MHRPAMLTNSAPSRIAACAIAFLAVACAPEAAEETPPGDAVPADSASMYADRLMEALGGEEAWDRTRYVSFRWIIEREGQVVADRRHSWDRYDGRYRLEYEQGGQPHVYLFDVNEVAERPGLGKVPEGRAWIGGTEVTGAARDSVLRRAYGAFINDTYWALMPFKWEDPGVHLSYEGFRTLSDSASYATVHLTFEEGLGVTEDEYWGFLDPESGLMAAWQYHLGRSDEAGDVVWWEDWRDIGEIRFAMSRRSAEQGRFMRFEDVVASPTVPDGRFAPPTP